MTATSISIAHGANGVKISDFTVGTLALGAGDVEVRMNNTNSNGKNISTYEWVIMLRLIIRQLETTGPAGVNINLRTGASPPPPLL